MARKVTKSKKKIASPEDIEVINDVTKVFVYWGIRSRGDDYNPEKYDEEINDEALAKIIKGKLKWAGVDVVIPDELLTILMCCSETPAEIQMLTVDILETIKTNNDGYIPSHYIITPEDVANTFPERLPYIFAYSDIKNEYNKKWDMQKFVNDNGIKMNMYDTKQFWEPFKNV